MMKNLKSKEGKCQHCSSQLSLLLLLLISQVGFKKTKKPNYLFSLNSAEGKLKRKVCFMPKVNSEEKLKRKVCFMPKVNSL